LSSIEVEEFLCLANAGSALMQVISRLRKMNNLNLGRILGHSSAGLVNSENATEGGLGLRTKTAS